MATLVRCIEGHEFESAVSETCPICGSAVSKKEPVVENKPPLGRTGAKKIAEDIVLFGCAVFVLSFFALTFGKNLPAGGIKSVVHDAWERITDKSVIHDTWERIMDPRSHLTDEEAARSILKRLRVDEKRNSPTKKLDAGSKPDDENVAAQPPVAKEIPNPFALPKPGNPFDPKIRFDSK